MMASSMAGPPKAVQLKAGPAPAWNGAPCPEQLPGMGPSRFGIARRDDRARRWHGVSATPIPLGDLPVIGRGRPLEPDVRRTMEAFFEADLSSVRVFEGSTAAAMGALAFTRGEQVHFSPGLYQPTTPGGLELLGHELAHVMQQRQGRVTNPYGHRAAIVQDPALEVEAHAMGRRLAEQAVGPARRDGRPAAAQARFMGLGMLAGGYIGNIPGFLLGGAIGGLVDYGLSVREASLQRAAMADAFDGITQNLGYVATAYARQELAGLQDGARNTLVERIVAADTRVKRAYFLVQGLFGGTIRAVPSQQQLAGLITQMGANAAVNGWSTDGTSDPRNDDLSQAHAKLIVHSFTPFARMNANGVPNALNAYVDNAVITGVHGKVGVRTCASYLANAAHPGGSYCLSTSLIGKAQKGTIGPVGIILNVPVWNLLLIGPRDLNIDNGAMGNWTPTRIAGGQQNAREISENGTQTSLEALEAYTPAQLIAATTNYSELGVMGTCLRGTAPTVTGIFVVVKNGYLCEDGGYLPQATLDLIDPTGQSQDYQMARQNSYYRGIGQLGATSMVDRIANSANQHGIPVVVINNPATNLPQSTIQLTTLTNHGGAWANITVHNF